MRNSILILCLILVIPTGCRTIKNKKSMRSETEFTANKQAATSISNLAIDTSREEAKLRKKKVTQETFHESSITIEQPKSYPTINIGNDLVLDSNSSLDTLKWFSKSNPSTRLLVYNHPSTNKAVAEIQKNGSDTVVPFTKIQINTKSGTKTVTEDLDSSSKNITRKIIQNTLDSQSAHSEKSSTTFQSDVKDIIRKQGGIVWTILGVVLLVLVAVFFYIKKIL